MLLRCRLSGTPARRPLDERAIAERNLAEAIPEPPVSEAEVRALLAQLGDITRRLGIPTATKATLYDKIGLRVFYTPGSDEFQVTVRPGVPRGERWVGGLERRSRSLA